ncbi:MAG: integrase [Hyphomicrobiales bacterium]|nr:MAG: integrase [Hyphomicrobiales bacterium]
MSNESLTRFFGGSPGRVLIRLILMSFVVGLVLSALNLHPFEILDWIRSIVHRIYNLGFDAIEQVFTYFLLGAAIVFPIWLIIRLLNLGRPKA